MVQDTTNRNIGTGTSGFAGSQQQGARITGTSHLDDRSGPGPEIMAACHQMHPYSRIP